MAFTIVKSDGTSLSFDTTISEEFAPEIAVTNHPIEDGSNISDHAQEMPNNFSVRSIITYTPLSGRSNQNLVPASGSQRVEIVLDFLKSCIAQFLVVETTNGKLIKNCLLTRYNHAFDVRKAVYFELQFRVARIATSQVVQIRTIQHRKKVDTGSNSLEVCDPADPKYGLDVANIGLVAGLVDLTSAVIFGED